MPHPCVVCGRSRLNPNNKVEDYIFFGFPVNDEPRCKKWLEFSCREDLYKLSKKQLLQRVVCSKHFTPSDFISDFHDRLSNTAVPSVYDPKQSLYNIVCVLCGCARKDPSDDFITFHHFPGEEFRCLNWLDFVGIDSYYRLTRKETFYCYICSKHFHRNQFVPGFCNRLIDSALPTIKFPDTFSSKTNQKSSDLSIESDDVELFETPKKDTRKLSAFPLKVLEGRACVSCGIERSDVKAKGNKLKFHPFPAYEIGRCLKWCKFLNREDILKMTPNQIRKMVLCSGHFPVGQTFNDGANDPCDAVPTIHNYDLSMINRIQNSTGFGEGGKCFRVLVSSKKPKDNSENKPTPLAKKRGKSKRPTIINIPKPELDNRIRKLPIPSAANDWKVIANQFQPITIANNLVHNTGVKIVPFAGNIANLGTSIAKPIPVTSLASIPPGLLIKINLPNQNKTPAKGANRRARGRGVKRVKTDTSNNMPIIKKETVEDSNTEGVSENETLHDFDQVAYDYSNHMEDSKIANETYPSPQYTHIIKKETVEDSNTEGVSENETLHDFDQVAYDYSNHMEDSKIANETYPSPHDSQSYLQNTNIVSKVADKQLYKNKKLREQKVVKKRQTKLRMSTKCKKSLMPIQCELKRFLDRIAPFVRRLPNKSKAQVKLAIVNKVIEKL